jgi:hypothetical protein
MTDRNRLHITDVHQPSVAVLLAENVALRATIAELDALVAEAIEALEWFGKQELSMSSVSVVLDLGAKLQRAVNLEAK